MRSKLHIFCKVKSQIYSSPAFPSGKFSWAWRVLNVEEGKKWLLLPGIKAGSSCLLLVNSITEMSPHCRLEFSASLQSKISILVIKIHFNLNMRYIPLFYRISQVRQKWFLYLNCTIYFKISYFYYTVLYPSHLTNISLYKQNRLMRISTIRRPATYFSSTCIMFSPRFGI